MLDVAKRAGVSISSVSRVANNFPAVHPTLRFRVDSAIKELGYIRRSTRKRYVQPGIRLIYFLLANLDLHIPFQSRLLQAIENECGRHGDLILFRTLRYTPETPSDELHLGKLLEVPFADRQAVRPDGVILTGLTYPNLLQALKKLGIPFILLGNSFAGRDPAGDAVHFDLFKGAREATSYLIELGHANILFIGDTKRSWFSSLYEGYLRAVREANLSSIAQTKALSDSFYLNGYLSVEMVLGQTNGLTAIFAGYDDTAMGAWKALSDRNLSVPRDVSLIGFDDEDYAAFTVPALTTVRVDVEALGRELITQLYRKLQNPSVTLPAVKLDTTLVKRGTCWPATVLSHSSR